MKFRTLLTIACVIIVGLAGMTIAEITQQRRSPSNAILQAIQLTDVEIENILYMRQEEKLARDVYLTLYEQWGATIFANISESEQRHMDALKRLVTLYGLEDTITNNAVGWFDDPVFKALYEQFVADGTDSLSDALNVGVSIEELDIADLTEALEQTSMRNVRRVFENLLRGSTNHLAAFQKCLETCDTECLQTGTCSGTCLQNQDRDSTCQNL